VLFAILPYAARLRLVLALRRLLSLCGLRWLALRMGLLRLLPSRLRQLEALAPDTSLRQLLSRPPSRVPASGELRRRVALLSGCVQSVAFPEVNRATARVLAAEGCEVVVPAGLGCCGALSTHAGRREEAKAFARRAMAAFEAEPVDVVVVNAAGCGAALKHLPRLFADESDWLPRARALAEKVRDACELLSELEPRAPRHPLKERAAYHDACHLSHGQGVAAQPRQLLSAVPELEVCEVPDGDQCCGSAGIYNLLEPESAELIGRRKAENVALVEPSVLISANPGCSLQIQRHLGESGRKIRVAHPVEVLDASIRGVPLPRT
jgi:glycolate oxidase iron-sulfur subunit